MKRRACVHLETDMANSTSNRFPAFPSKLSELSWVWSLGGLSVRELGRRTGRALLVEDTLGRAAELSYYFVLALFPFLMCVSSVIGLIFSTDRQFYQRVLEYAQTVMPSSAYAVVQAAASDLARSATGAKLSLALVFALWTASLGMDAVIKGLNVAYDVREFRAWWKRRLIAIVLTIVQLILLQSALLTIVAGNILRNWLSAAVSSAFLDPAWVVAQWAIVLTFLLIALSITYIFGPNLKEQRFRAVLPGAIVAFICWVAVSLGFRMYLRYFDSYSNTYGSLGAVIVLLLWLYLSGTALLVGGEVNAQIRHAAAAAGEPEAQRITERHEK